MVHFADIVHDILDPFVHRKTGISMSLIGAWSEIIGESVVKHCRPEKIIWPSGGYALAKSVSTGVISGILVIACEGAYAVFLMHDQPQIIRRVNDFFGFRAINKIRIIQKNMCAIANKTNSDHVIPELIEDDSRKIYRITEGIESIPLKKALIRFGYAVFRSSYL